MFFWEQHSARFLKSKGQYQNDESDSDATLRTERGYFIVILKTADVLVLQAVPRNSIHIDGRSFMGYSLQYSRSPRYAALFLYNSFSSTFWYSVTVVHTLFYYQFPLLKVRNSHQSPFYVCIFIVNLIKHIHTIRCVIILLDHPAFFRCWDII